MRHTPSKTYKIFTAQLGIVAFVAFLFMFDSSKAAYSLFLGSCCCLIPNFIFARKLFAHQDARQVKQAIKAFYRGEAFKLLLIGGLSLIVFMSVKIAPLYFFGGFLVAQIAFWCIGTLSLRARGSYSHEPHSVEVNS
jgi:F0F1-type ATP synthase assembly protein I